ncbi:MAG: iron-sulfur cluster assembly accessory protein [Runella slithyformis]|jgi:iron-sulfur cluster assembly protein|nr:MAG: iron-sulfur cluster assembly accessory protein [Runella slithyformis]TAF93173.1 MAG: iron-sulfur cluster assembly accessory protein [Runella sp.]TAG23726.1 MAG: iron-sulfur cluster assembly accessory protein [Cytophagales bacterium]TAG39040.1 MAG: iron-sulfur cluster assembly accessory protein [Cytophagia bacterium]TAF01652.1 MAG: iron-sulfur cluster assembly accessory protein [Runella slithyformis]
MINEKVNPVKITDLARGEIKETLHANKIPDTYGLRVGMKGGGCGAQFLLGFDLPTPTDQIYWIEGVKVIIDKRHLMYVIGSEIDFEETEAGMGFTINKV